MKTETIIILAVVAVAGYYLYTQHQAAQANSNDATLASIEQGAGSFLSGLFA